MQTETEVVTQMGISMIYPPIPLGWSRKYYTQRDLNYKLGESFNLDLTMCGWT